jgi:hypothetical protein
MIPASPNQWGEEYSRSSLKDSSETNRKLVNPGFTAFWRHLRPFSAGSRRLFRQIARVVDRPILTEAGLGRTPKYRKIRNSAQSSREIGPGPLDFAVNSSE